jgi:hypothetical protein
MSRCELDQHVHVAFGAEVVTKNGSKEGQPNDVVAATELSDLALPQGSGSSAHEKLLL